MYCYQILKKNLIPAPFVAGLDRTGKKEEEWRTVLGSNTPLQLTILRVRYNKKSRSNVVLVCFETYKIIIYEDSLVIIV